MVKKLQLLSLPVGLGLVALALLALGPAARAEMTPDGGGEHHSVPGPIAAAVLPLSSAPLATTPSWTATGETDGDALGWSDGGSCIASAGDVNGDGYDDVIVSAYSHDGQKGKAYVYHGSPAGLSATAALTVTGQADGDQFGHAVAGVGDVNDDGYDDVLIGAPGVDAGGNIRGRAYLYLGSSGGLSSTPAATITGQSDGDALGISVSGAGDVNGDDYDDVLVGAPLADVGGFARGQVYLYLGSSGGLSPTPAFTATGQADSAQLSVSKAGAGDVNDDGYADVIISAYGAPDGTYKGQVYLYLGGSGGLSPSPTLTITGQADVDYLGVSGAGAGDVNDDGYADVIIGAEGAPGGNKGQVYLYLGNSGGLSPSPTLTITGRDDLDHLGFSVGGAGDVNGDGYADMLIGAPGVDTGGTSNGQAYLYLGSSSGLSPSPAFTVTGQADTDYLGTAVAGAGDVNGDGYADVLIGAAGAPDGAHKGQVYLYLGYGVESIYLPIIAKDSIGVSNLAVDRPADDRGHSR